MKSIPLLQLSLIAGMFGLGQTAMATVQVFGLERERNYDQSDSSTVTLATSDTYYSYAGVKESEGTSDFSSGTLVYPDNSNISLNSDEGGWWAETRTDSLDEVNDSWPEGIYTLTMNKAAGGSTVVTFDLTSLDFPIAPSVTNYDALQAIDATSDFTISWDAWADGTSDDLIVVYIRDANDDNVYSSNSFTDSEMICELDGTDTSITIPSGTLASGITYYMELQFCKCYGFSWSGAVSDYPDAVKGVTEKTTTNLTIQTAARVIHFMAEREIYYEQSDASTVALSTYEPYRGCVGLLESGPTSLFSAGTLTWPDSSTSTLSVETSDEGLGWSAYGTYDSLDELNAAYPIGSYTLTMTKASGGTTTVGFEFTTLEFPDAPMVTNFDDLQEIDATSATVITWDAWTGGTDSDIVLITIDDEHDDEIFSNKGSILDGTTVSATIPAGTLDPESTYYLMVKFMKTYGSLSTTGAVSDFPSAAKWKASESATTLTIHTAGIFGSLYHYDYGWISPEDPTDVTGSFGWVSDLFYPWIYSASQDILTNGSYLGDGDGWMYVYPGGTLSGGFYAYRYATGSWCWTSYYWSGWIYDYGTSSWIDITP